jgi:aspartate racemase
MSTGKESATAAKWKVMKTAGIIGGIAPESTIDYYRQIVAACRQRAGSYPSLIINSIDLTKMLGLIATDRDAATQYLVAEVKRLADAGAEFAALAANTPHIVFDEIRRRSSISMISIVDATLAAARAAGLERLGLFGTRFTMQGRVYPDAIIPSPDEQEFIDDKYMNELVKGTFLPETRDHLLAIARRMIERDRIDGLILGGTELPLLLRDAGLQDIPFLDTTKIHVEAIVEAMLSSHAMA